MKINDFSGGLNTRLDPTLLRETEAVIYNNIDNSANTLKSAKDYTTTTILSDDWIYKFRGSWYSSDTERDYIEYLNKLYYTQPDDRMYKVVDGVTKVVGLPKPLGALIIAEGAAGVLSTDATTVQYVYTYYDSLEGVESEPSPLSEELSLAANKMVDISNFLPPSLECGADLIRLYRLGADTTQFTLIVELPITTETYSDNTPSIDSLAIIVDTWDNQMPITGLRYLTTAYGIMFAALGSRLYYTLVGKPDAWPTDSFIDFFNDITGVFPIQDGILVFTMTSHYLLVGSTEETFVKTPLSTEEGCRNNKSCKIVKSTPVWISNNGICAYQGGAVSILSKELLGRITLDILNTAVYDEQYFVLLTDGTLLCMDLCFGRISIKKYTFSDLNDIGIYDGIFYASINGAVCTMFTGDDLELQYMSPEFTEGDLTVTKMYNNVYIYLDGSFVIEIYIDGVEVSNENIEMTGILDLKVPQERQRGSYIQFKITGIGTVKEIEYKVIGRQNGR